MTIIDILIAVFVLALAALGFERGLIRSALPLAGFIAGAAAGGRLGPALLADGSDSAYAPVITVMCGLLLGAVLATALEGVGSVLRERARMGDGARLADGAGGALLLGVLGLLVVWAFGAVALNAPGSNSVKLRQAVQRSTILGALNEALPPSGPLLNVLRRIDPTPALEGPEADVGPPDPKIASDPEVERAGLSVVRVLGTACGLGVEGSGWAIAPDLIATNAHVIAGQDDTTVTPQAGVLELDAQAVHYDPRNDFALLRVPGLGLEPVPLVSDPKAETPGAILGYPENGPYAVRPARLGTTAEVTSEDSYGRGPVRREMTAFRGDVRSGNSGGPVVDGDGRVLTTIFGAELGDGPAGGLGVPNAVAANAASDRLAPVDTGPCAA
jgi:Trypsin-like peptidase domain/Colicin V production protein